MDGEEHEKQATEDTREKNTGGTEGPGDGTLDWETAVAERDARIAELEAKAAEAARHVPPPTFEPERESLASVMGQSVAASAAYSRGLGGPSRGWDDGAR